MCYQPSYSLFSLDFLCDKASEVHPGFTSSLVLSGFSSLLGVLRDVVLLPNLPFSMAFLGGSLHLLSCWLLHNSSALSLYCLGRDGKRK